MAPLFSWGHKTKKAKSASPTRLFALTQWQKLTLCNLFIVRAQLLFYKANSNTTTYASYVLLTLTLSHHARDEDQHHWHHPVMHHCPTVVAWSPWHHKLLEILFDSKIRTHNRLLCWLSTTHKFYTCSLNSREGGRRSIRSLKPKHYCLLKL